MKNKWGSKAVCISRARNTGPFKALNHFNFVSIYQEVSVEE
jgi:hypothetical protein